MKTLDMVHIKKKKNFKKKERWEKLPIFEVLFFVLNSYIWTSVIVNTFANFQMLCDGSNALKHTNRDAFLKDISGITFLKISWHCKRHQALESLHMWFESPYLFFSPFIFISWRLITLQYWDYTTKPQSSRQYGTGTKTEILINGTK